MVIDPEVLKEALKVIDVVNDVRYLSDEEQQTLIAVLCRNLGWEFDEVEDRLAALELEGRISLN